MSILNSDFHHGLLDAAPTRFRRTPCVTLPQFVEPGLAAWFRDAIAGADFKVWDHTAIDASSRDLRMDDAGILARLLFLLNHDEPFEALQCLTGCEPIGSFQGGVYRMVPGEGHHLSWHDDVAGTRMLALSIDFSLASYTGGAFQLRDKHSGGVIHERVNTRLGDAVLFRVGTDLQHRVLPVEGGVAKTAFAGWFSREPYAPYTTRRRR